MQHVRGAYKHKTIDCVKKMDLKKRFIPVEGCETFQWLRFTIPYRHVAAGILSLGIVLRLLGLNKGLWTDEYASLKVITSGDFLHLLSLQNKPPLFYLFHKLCSLISTSEPLLRLTSVCFGVGTLVMVMRWIKRYSLSAGLLAGLLCATMPIMLRYSQEIRGYSLLLLAAVCSFYFASRLAASPEESSEYIGVSLGLSVAVATHLTAIMLVPAVLVFIAFSGKDLRRINPAKSLLAIAAPSIIFLCFYLFFLSRLPDQGGWWMPAVSFSSALSTVSETLGISYLLAAARTIQARSSLLALICAYGIKLILIGLCISLAFFGDWRRSLPFLVAAVSYWILLIGYSLLAIPVFWYRIALPGLIPFIGFIALQIDGMRIPRVKRASLAGIIILCTVFGAGWTVHSAWVPYEQWKQLSESLKAQWTQNDLVLFYPHYAAGPVRYYFPDLSTERGLPVAEGIEMKKVAEEILGHMKRREETDGGHTLFLVVRADLRGRKGLRTYHNLLSYLEAECGPSVLSKKFGNLSLSKYTCPLPK